MWVVGSKNATWTPGDATRAIMCVVGTNNMRDVELSVAFMQQVRR